MGMHRVRRRWRLGVLAALSIRLGVVVAGAPAQAPVPPAAPARSCAEMETFLKTARIGPQRDLPVGVTAPSRATLDDGSFKHDAAIQTVDIRKTTFQTPRGTELNFRDSWQFNVAGYELAKLLELNMVPPYVQRRVRNTDASVTWWVNDAKMERDRVSKNLTPPNPQRWNDEMHASRLFHVLIGDGDYNMTNTLIAPDWRVWMIDFTRAFRLIKSLDYAKDVTRVDRKLYANLRGLSREVLQERLGTWLTKAEIDAVLGRKDLLVRALEAQIASRGEAVFYELPRVGEPCGTGLQ